MVTRSKNKKLIIIAIILLIVGVGTWIYFAKKNAPQMSSSSQTSGEEQVDTTEEAPVAGFNKSLHSIDDPSSIWVVVNKQRPLPLDYEPPLVVPDVRLRLAASQQQMQISSVIEPAIQEMFAAAQADGVSLIFGSGYRSAALQKQFYDSYVAQDGQAMADTYSARPGHSEHQTGLALDITSPNGVCSLEICWEATPEGKWVAANAHKYGFIIRYQQGKESITGYQYEPWHLRYVGKELATELTYNNQTLEEFFGLGAAPNYD